MKLSIILLPVLLIVASSYGSSNYEIGKKMLKQRDYEAAISSFNVALDEEMKADSEIRVICDIYYYLAFCYYRTKQYDTCDSLLTLSLSKLPVENKSDEEELLYPALHLYAVALSFQDGKRDSLEYYYKKTLKLAEKLWGKNSTKSASVMENLAGLYRTEGRYGEAIDLLKQSLEIWTYIYGEDAKELIMTIDDIGFNYMLADSLQLAMEYYNRAKLLSDFHEVDNILTENREKRMSDIKARLDSK